MNTTWYSKCVVFEKVFRQSKDKSEQWCVFPGFAAIENFWSTPTVWLCSMFSTHEILVHYLKSIKISEVAIFNFSKDLDKLVWTLCKEKMQPNYSSNISRKGRNIRRFQILHNISDFTQTVFYGELTSVSYSWNFILASDTHATKPVQKVQLNSCAVPLSTLNFSKTTVVAAIKKWFYFVDSGMNSAEIKFVLEGGLLACSSLSTITQLGLMLLELVDVILPLIKLCRLNHWIKIQKNESMRFSNIL